MTQIKKKTWGIQFDCVQGRGRQVWRTPRQIRPWQPPREQQVDNQEGRTRVNRVSFP